jgi:hypothetical protein
MTNDLKSVLFPIFSSFPNVLTFGSSLEPKKSIEGKKVLIYLDATGSMGEYCNETGECSKMILAKETLEKVLISRGYNYEIVPFNTYPLEKCSLEKLPQPHNSTYFSPLVDDLTERVKDGNYCAVVFMSDGLPSEPSEIARNAIKTIGNITREAGANPVSVAIGSDADGRACAVFAGNRGYNCFIKYRKDVEQIANDISNGIECNYFMMQNGSFIPIEADGNYYYVNSDVGATTIKANRFLVEKYLNLVIHKYMADVTQHQNLKSLVGHTVKLLDNIVDQTELVDKYNDMLKVIEKVIRDNYHTPGVLSAAASAYRQASGGQV